MSGERVRCPVLTCSNEMSVDSIMCIACWQALPAYQRTAVETASSKVRRQRNPRTAARLNQAIAAARTAAASVRR